MEKRGLNVRAAIPFRSQNRHTTCNFATITCFLGRGEGYLAFSFPQGENLGLVSVRLCRRLPLMTMPI